MTTHTNAPTEFAPEHASREAREYLDAIGYAPVVGYQAELLAAILRRIYQEGVVAGYDRAVAVIEEASKGVRR